MGNVVDKSHSATSNLACIPTHYSRLIARLLELQEPDLPALLELTQLSIGEFMQEGMLLTSPQQIQIWHNAQRLSDDETFGLRLGKMATLPIHGAIGFMVNSSPNLLTALKALQDFLPSRLSYVRTSLVINQDWLSTKIGWSTTAILMWRPIQTSFATCQRFLLSLFSNALNP